MTAFQKLVEMPISEREDSYAPGGLAEKLLPIHPQSAGGRWTLNFAAHTALGAMWGAAYGVAAHKGLRGARGAAATFAAIYSQDLVMIPALRLGKPWEWSRKDWTIDAHDGDLRPRPRFESDAHVGGRVLTDADQPLARGT
jgi:hypothetical protein